MISPISTTTTTTTTTQASLQDNNNYDDKLAFLQRFKREGSAPLGRCFIDWNYNIDRRRQRNDNKFNYSSQRPRNGRNRLSESQRSTATEGREDSGMYHRDRKSRQNVQTVWTKDWNRPEIVETVWIKHPDT